MAEKDAHGSTRAARQSTKGSLTRQRIVAATAALLREGDPTMVTIPDIAARADTSKGSVYYYFADLDQILREVIMSEVEALVSSFEKVALTSLTAYDALVGITRAYMETLRANSTLMAFVLGELHGPFNRDKEQDSFVELRSRLNALVSLLLERGKREGGVRGGIDSEVACSAILGAFLGMAAGIASNRYSSGDVDRIVRSLIDFIGFGISSGNQAT